MSFMNLYTTDQPFWSVENTRGESTLVPADLVASDPELADFADYVDGTPESFELVTGWFARYSASGYMDCTEWSGPYATEAEAIEETKAVYGDEEEES